MLYASLHTSSKLFNLRPLLQQVKDIHWVAQIYPSSMLPACASESLQHDWELLRCEFIVMFVPHLDKFYS